MGKFRAKMGKFRAKMGKFREISGSPSTPSINYRAPSEPSKGKNGPSTEYRVLGSVLVHHYIMARVPLSKPEINN